MDERKTPISPRDKTPDRDPWETPPLVRSQLRAFFTYMNSELHEVAALTHKSLQDELYHMLYSEPAISDRQKNYDVIEEDLRIWKEEIAHVIEELRDLEMRGFPFTETKNPKKDFWLFHKIHGGNTYKYGTGRLYFNVQPPEAPIIYRDLLMDLAAHNTRACMKIARKPTKNTMTRTEKIILYLDEEYARNGLESMDRIYDLYEYAFEKELPFFTTPLRKRDGRPMRGISFGEEPIQKYEKLVSFGESRIMALVALWNQGTRVRNPEDPREIDRIYPKFRVIAHRHDIDPENLAFNRSLRGGKNFAGVRRRAGLWK